MGGMTRHISPTVTILRDAAQVRQKRPHLGAAAENQFLATFYDHGDIAGKLDSVAVTLIADQQQASGR